MESLTFRWAPAKNRRLSFVWNRPFQFNGCCGSSKECSGVIPVVCLTSVQLRDDASMTIVRNRLIRCVRHNFPLCSDPREANLHVHVGTPHVMPQTKTRRATAKFVFYTLAEASRVPGQWVEVLNKCDEVWTASRFSRDAFVNSGVTRPIHVIPLGIDCPREPLV